MSRPKRAGAMRPGAARRARDWAPYLALPVAYAALARIGAHAATRAHVQPQLGFDRAVFGGTVPTVALQEALWDPDDPRWWDLAAWLVYLSHFVVTVAIAFALWFGDLDRFRRWRRLVLATSFAGFATYLAYPALPPWLASIRGDMPRTDRLVRAIWDHLGAHKMAAVFGQNSKVAFEVGALPSLHAAAPFGAMLFFWARAGWPVRLALAAYTLAMAVTLVYSADHFVFDILAGWGYSAVAYALLG
jgi:PAP2 superfamily